MVNYTPEYEYRQAIALTIGEKPFGPLDVIATLITTEASAVETIADEQLWKFISIRRQPGEIMDKGLWAYSRHPNYFGEVMF
jgi:steroid 5-alpha reductase family enzyme